MEITLHGIKSVYADLIKTGKNNSCLTLTVVRKLPVEDNEVEYVKIDLFGKPEDLEEIKNININKETL